MSNDFINLSISIASSNKAPTKKSIPTHLRHDVGRLIVESIIGLKWKGLKNHCSCDLAAKQAKRLGGHKGKKKLFSRLSKVVRHLHGCSQKAKRTIVQKKYKKVIDILDKMGKKAKNKLKSKAKKSLRKSKKYD